MLVSWNIKSSIRVVVDELWVEGFLGVLWVGFYFVFRRRCCCLMCIWDTLCDLFLLKEINLLSAVLGGHLRFHQ